MTGFFKASKTAVAHAAQDETASSLPNIDGDKLAEIARNLGAEAGDASGEAINLVMKAKEDWQGGPFKVLFGLQADYTEEQLNSFAIPDTEDGNNPDVFKVHKTDAKGKSKLVNTTFYTQFADGTPDGQAILARIEFTERAGNKDMVKDDIPADILEMSPHEREVHLNFLKGRRGTIRQAYKKAMALYFQFQLVNEYDGIMAEPIWVKGKGPNDIKEGELPEVENTTKPIAVWLIPDEGRPVAKWEALSIGAFMKLDTRKAMEKGGTFAALIESGATKKAPGSGSQTNKNEGLVIKTLETGISVLAEFHRWSDEINGAKDKAEIGKLYKLMNAKDNDELIVAVVEVRNFLQQLAKDTAADAKYVRLQQGGSDLVAETAA